jgi:hypothetical protein
VTSSWCPPLFRPVAEMNDDGQLFLALCGYLANGARHVEVARFEGTDRAFTHAYLSLCAAAWRAARGDRDRRAALGEA